ncbi:glycosyltransferase family 4 protein [Flagellimonas sp.]|uniref:glycosyltransferase family 4 protein n=1 Tax=Flagellimonas sp. TaxID=2058762 RepID=UPI003F4A485A
MKVILLALRYSNKHPNGGLYNSLMSEMRANGHTVFVVAPSNSDKKTGLFVEHGINVLRVKTYKLFNVGIIRKGIANVMLPYQYKKALMLSKLNLNEFDLVVIPTPPITLMGTARWLKRKSNAKLYLILRDIFPQNGVDLGIMKSNSLIHKYFRKKEMALYKISDNIGCMSQGNIDYVKKHNPWLHESKLHLMPNWEHLPEPISEEKSESVKAEYGLEHKFIVIFGGNMGKPQKLENIIQLAKNCTEIKDMMFLLIGSGTEKNKIETLIEEEDLANVRVINFMPKKDYNSILMASDIGLISLNEDFTIPNFPSKVMSYFGAKVPVLASIDLNTDFGTMLDETASGFWAEAGNTKDLKEKLLQLYENPELRKTMGENGYIHMKTNWLPEYAYTRLMDEIK